MNLDSIPMKVSFLPLETDMDTEEMVLRWECQKGDWKQQDCQGYSM